MSPHDTAGAGSHATPPAPGRVAVFTAWISGHKPECLALLGLLVCWSGFLHQLHFNWGSESYYSFGWFVLPMALWLARARWVDEGKSWGATPPGRGTWALVAIALLLALHLPFRVAVDVNPFWRLPLWGAGITLIAATGLLVVRLLGRRAGWSLAFPVIFLVTMLPWPSHVEGAMINSMTKLVVAANIELLRLFGLPAEAQGNVILLGSTAVGVDDACSGIRSLQTLGMLALFVGEFWRLTVVRRISLFAVAAVAALIFNVSRALALALCVFHGGDELYDSWHDPAGYISLGGSTGVLLLVAWRFGRKPVPLAPAAPARTAPPTARLSWAAAGVTATLCLTATAAPTLWFLQDTPDNRSKYDIAVQWPRSAPYSCSELTIDDRVREILGYDYAERLAIRTATTDEQAEIWHYGFDGGSGSKSIAAYIHSPTICMTANGAQLQGTHEQLNVDLGPFSLPFQHFTFRSAPATGGRPIQVFWCMWEGVTGEEFINPNDFRTVVMNSLKSGRRNLERSVILIGIHNQTAEAARRSVTRLVQRSVTPVVNGSQVSYLE